MPLVNFYLEVDEVSELAQIGTPRTPESMRYLTQSPIKQDEKMSEISSQLDIIVHFLENTSKRHEVSKNLYGN